MGMKIAGAGKGAKSGGKGPSWLKRGKDAAQSMKQEDARQEQRREERDRLFRFRLKEGEEASLTFLDGNLVQVDSEAEPDQLIFDVPHFHEHEVWGFARRGPTYFVCVGETEPCPLCADGNDAYYVALFTVIDHRGFDRQNGDKVTYSRKLFPAKSQTIKKLMLAAKKRQNSLVGLSVDVSRSDQRSARVGDDFAWQDRETPEALAKSYPDAAPLEATDFEKELSYRDADELRSMGFGSGAGTPVGQHGSGNSAGSDAGDAGEIPF